MLDNPLLEQFGVNPDALIPHAQGAAPVVRIEDRICSAGKTKSMIEGLNPLRQYLIVTPLLEDVADIIERAEVPLSQPMARPELRNDGDRFSFAHTKRGHLRELLLDRTSIVCTHALYSDIAWAAREGLLTGYDIVIDEIPNTVDVISSGAKIVPPGQINALVWRNQYIRDGYAEVADNGQVHPTEKWADDVRRGENFLSQTLYSHAEAGCLWSADDTVLIWELPTSLLTVGRTVTVMTYRFEGSLLHAFMQKHGIEYRAERTPDQQAEEELLRAKAKELITIKPIPGLESTKFSAGALEPAKLTPAIQKKLVNALKRLRRTDLKDAEPRSVLVTSLKGLWYKNGKSEADLPDGKRPAQGPICKQGQKTTGMFNLCCWSANVTRGTNAFRDCDKVLYLYDKNLNPNIAKAFKLPPLGEANDLYAVSELVQFIYRSAIRKRTENGSGDPYVPVTIYLPSARMRDLLQRWLDGDI